MAVARSFSSEVTQSRGMGNFGVFFPFDNALWYEFRYEGPVWLEFTFDRKV